MQLVGFGYGRPGIIPEAGLFFARLPGKKKGEFTLLARKTRVFDLISC
jgi:hypothetical protein